jgi:hypothetical protein
MASLARLMEQEGRVKYFLALRGASGYEIGGSVLDRPVTGAVYDAVPCSAVQSSGSLDYIAG